MTVKISENFSSRKNNFINIEVSFNKAFELYKKEFGDEKIDIDNFCQFLEERKMKIDSEDFLFHIYRLGMQGKNS